MTKDITTSRAGAGALVRYYLLRAVVAAAWVAAAFTLGTSSAVVAGLLLVLYPAWDAFANARDASANGGFRANVPQALNAVVSAAVALGVLAALRLDPRLVLVLFGVWAVLSGLLQLAVGLRRWRTYGAQWAMVLSGAQSALAGGFFVSRAAAPAVAPVLAVVAPYAAFGAFYFLLSAILLALKTRRRAETA
ncbi:hypothetical protein [Caulobacter sp. UNC279MFTsu5.1]|uniref:hypothetical protein n=1 Tax=Caulobacter sp. UNC279MFTsu5.1 TaxID=1502775 RepID=UPI0008E2BC8C|nr:hypothetical protein [Caulobacter sp. UNC279MFTsu5.1]SFK13033.1 hypothetical protein SAMN02799626_03475 [Caulobacter sp. UNC279MFTsu5.1]